MPTFEYSVPTVTCSVCTGAIDRTLEEARRKNELYSGIRSLNIDLTYEPPRAFVDVLPDSDAKAVKTELNNQVSCVGHEFTEVVPIKSEIRNHFLKGLLGIFAGVLILGLCISGLQISFLMMGYISFLGTVLTLYLGKETYKEAFKKLKSKQLTMHTLFSISTLMAIGITLAHFFVPWLPMMLDTALLIFGFVHIGKAYEKSTKRAINRASSYRSLAAATILVREEDGSFKEMLIHQIRPGQIIRVLRKQIVPLDGHYLPEEKSARKRTIINPYNGSNLPETGKPEALVLAGSIVPEDLDFIELKVSASEEDSYLAFLEAQSKKTLAKTARLETAASKLLQYFVPTVLILAILSSVAIGVLFTPLTALQVAATILASACPCTLGLIIPLAIKVGFLKAHTQDIHFANGEALQAANEVDTIVFDLNGTLTTGEIRVTSGLATLAPTNLSPRMLDYLAAVEQLSEHVFARAIRHYIHNELRRDPQLCPEAILQEQHHSGLSALIQGKLCIVGNQDLMLEKGFTKAALRAARISGHEAEHVVYLAYDGKIQGCILLSDPLRKEAAEVIRALQEQGKEIHLCTGASLGTAKRYARKLERLGTKPLKQIAANCLPDSKDENANTKTGYINRLKAQGRKVAMIGDGLNDSSAFERSHFSIAIESANGHQITQDRAGAVIRKKDNVLSLRSILSAFLISKMTVRNIKQNLAISLSYNLLAAFAIGGFLVGLGFVMNPALGAALMFIQSAFIFVNLQRFKKKKLPYVNDIILKDQISVPCENTTGQLKRVFPYPKRSSAIQDDIQVNYGHHGKKPRFYSACCSNGKSEKKQPLPLSKSHSSISFSRSF